MLTRIILFLLLFFNKVMNYIIYLLFFIIVCICFYAIYDSYQIYDRVHIDRFLRNAIDEVTNEVNFDYLHNDNIIGWINIYDTLINYPILKSSDNKYYLNKDYKGQYSDAGSIFLDYRNNNFNREYFNNHLNGKLKLRNKSYDINVLMFAKINAYDIVYNLREVKNNSDLVYRFIKSKSKYSSKYKYSDKLLMLSTCNDAHSNYRLVLLVSLKLSS